MGRESKSVRGFMAVTTNFSNHCTNFSHLRWMPLLLTCITRIITATGWQHDLKTRCETSMLREIANDEQNLSVNWPVMFDEQALVWSQAREQGRRRLHDVENDIDGKLAQIDVSSCTEKLFLSHGHYHNQLAPSCTSVHCRPEYWRWNHPLYCNLKNANLKWQ